MHSKKRKTSYLELYYAGQEDDEEEDEWEREASSSSSKHKQLPPNPYAIQVDILNNQQVVLNENIHHLTEQLEHLEHELEQLEQEECLQDASKSHQEYINTLEKTVSLIETTVDNNEQETYPRSAELLTNDIEKIVDGWKHMLVSYQQQGQNELQSLAHAYRATEFDIIDLISQIKGYEARIQVLDRERAKLNSLPQIIPILTSETENMSNDMKKVTMQLEELEKSTLRPQLKQLADLDVMIPFQRGQLTKDVDLMRDLKSELDKAQHILVKQRALQQMLVYTCDISRMGSKSKLDAIKSVVEAMEDRNLNVDKPLENKNTKDSKHHITTIKDLLAKFFQDNSDVLKKTLPEQIQALMHCEAELKSKWQDDFQSCLDAAQELGALQRRLQETLYMHSSSNENLILTPKPYISLQSELEFRTLEIKASLAELEKKLHNTDNNILFEQQRKLFSLFFTDPISFEQLHSDIVNE